jgi:MFS family permease
MEPTRFQMPGIGQTLATGKKRRVFFGWYIVAATAVQAFYTSGAFFFGFTAFFNPIANEFGWSRAATAAALALQRTESGIVGPFVGFLVDRYGARGVMLVGTVVVAIGFFSLARISSLPTFYLSFGLLALGISMSTMVTTMPVISNWFMRRRSRAMTLAFCGGASGGLVAPLLVWAIANYGWRTILDWIAVGYLLIGIVVTMFLRHHPEPYGYLPDGRIPNSDDVHKKVSVDTGDTPDGVAVDNGQADEEISFTLRQMMRTPALWLLVFGMGISGLVMSAIGLFVIPGLESYGISTATAAIAVMFIAIFNLIGRFVLGFLGDYMDKRYLLAFTYLMLALGSLAFASIYQVWHIAFFVLLYPLGHGGTVPLRFAILADYFGRKSYGALLGLTMTLTAVFGIIGPVFTGLVFDLTGSYRIAFLVIGVISLTAVPLTLLVKKPALRQ